MGEIARIRFTPKQKAELWERWKSGQCVADIAGALERRNKSGVYRQLALTRNGGASSYRASEAEVCAWDRALRPKPWPLGHASGATMACRREARAAVVT
jgi:hypothetical protein